MPAERVRVPASLSCAAILFDLDGVLVDSRLAVERAWRGWATARGLDAERIVGLLHGRRAIDVVRLVAPHLDAAAEKRTLIARELDDTDGVVAAPGAARLVATLPPAAWAIVTSGTRAIATARLERARLPIPDVLITADDVIDGKPHPEGYLRAAALRRVPPARCIVVEDAPAGVAAGRAADMTVIGVAPVAAPLTGARVCIPSLAALRAEVPAAGVPITLTVEETP
jgi:sugar-phosphatase